MTTKAGIAHCTARLLSCPDREALRRVWDSLGIAYQREPEISALKDRLKEELP